MANEEHLAILQQGVKIWNEWRRENREIIPDLIGAKLNNANLIDANLSGANLIDAYLIGAKLNNANLIDANLSGANLIKADSMGAKLSYVNLSRAKLSEINLIGANLGKADLIGANLSYANLSEAYLIGANLSNADLSNADLSGADLSRANLSSAFLRIANLSRTDVTATDFEGTICGSTIFADLDLSLAENLHLVQHYAPSTIGIDTLYASNGNIPREFLEGAGVPETMITFAKSLVANPIEYYSCFISYSTKDDEFARRLNERMKGEGLRVWFAPEEMKAGQKIHEQLYEAIRYHDKLILVLSEASMNSNWVQSEIRRARKHEREDKRRKLFPISLVPFGDIQTWDLFEADEGVDLAREIREYYIPDFSQWKDYDKFNAEFDKLLKALRADE